MAADYPKLLAPILSGAADVVYGSRFLGGSSSSSSNPEPESITRTRARTRTNGLHWHTLGNGLLTWASNRLTGLRLTDEATCYKLFKREVLARIDLTEDGFGFCPEVTAKVGKLVRQGSVRLVEVPIRYRGRTRADGKKIRLRDGLHALACLWRHRR